jgi:hypothetical protein
LFHFQLPLSVGYSVGRLEIPVPLDGREDEEEDEEGDSVWDSDWVGLLIVDVMVVVTPFTTLLVTITSHPVQTLVEEGDGDC